MKKRMAIAVFKDYGIAHLIEGKSSEEYEKAKEALSKLRDWVITYELTIVLTRIKEE